MSRSKPLSYSRALTELEGIVSEIESENADLDTIEEKIRRAASLITFCRDKLRNTEEEVKKILSEIEDSSSSEGEEPELER
jgi:exodeoxyribonuclease VII small subunit